MSGWKNFLTVSKFFGAIFLSFVLVIFKPVSLWGQSPTTYSFTEVLSRAVRMDRKLIAKREKIKTMRERYGDAIRNYLPEFSLSLQDIESRTPGALDSSSEMKLVQPLWTGGRLSGVLSQNKAGLRSSKLEYNYQAQKTVEEAAGAYFSLLEHQLNLERQTNLKMKVEEAYDLMKKKFNMGNTTRLKLLKTRQRKNEVTREYNQTKNNLSKAKLSLNKVLRRELDAPLRVKKGKFTGEDTPPERISNDRLKKAEKRILQHSFELRKARSEVKYYKYGVTLAYANYLPEFNLETRYRTEGESFFEGEQEEAYIGVNMKMFFFGHSVQSQYTSSEESGDKTTLNMTLFDNSSDIITTPISSRKSVRNVSSIDIQTQQAETRYKKAQNELKRTEKDATQTIRTLYYDLADKRLEIVNNIDKLEFHQENLQLLLTRQELGQATLLEVLDARIKKSNAKKSLIKSWLDYYFNRFKINLYTGQVDIQLNEYTKTVN